MSVLRCKTPYMHHEVENFLVGAARAVFFLKKAIDFPSTDVCPRKVLGGLLKKGAVFRGDGLMLEKASHQKAQVCDKTHLGI